MLTFEELHNRAVTNLQKASGPHEVFWARKIELLNDPEIKKLLN